MELLSEDRISNQQCIIEEQLSFLIPAWVSFLYECNYFIIFLIKNLPFPHTVIETLFVFLPESIPQELHFFYPKRLLPLILDF